MNHNIRKLIDTVMPDTEETLRTLKWEPSDPAVPLPPEAIAGEVLLGEFEGMTMLFCTVLIYPPSAYRRMRAAVMFLPMCGHFGVDSKDVVVVQCCDPDFARAFGMKIATDGWAEPNVYRGQRR